LVAGDGDVDPRLLPVGHVAVTIAFIDDDRIVARAAVGVAAGEAETHVGRAVVVAEVVVAIAGTDEQRIDDDGIADDVGRRVDKADTDDRINDDGGEEDAAVAEFDVPVTGDEDVAAGRPAIVRGDPDIARLDTGPVAGAPDVT